MGGALNPVTLDDIPSGYTKCEGYEWGTTIDGRTPYMCYKKVGDEFYYKGFYGSTWYDLYVVSDVVYGEGTSQTETYTYYYVGSNEIYWEISYFLA